MFFRLAHPAVRSTPDARREWGKMLEQTGWVGWSEVVVGPPYKPQVMQAWVIEVADWAADFFQERLAPLLFETTLQPGVAVRHRKEWCHQAILVPAPTGTGLPTGVIDATWASAGLDLRVMQTRQGVRVRGRVRYAKEDHARWTAGSVGDWSVRPMAAWHRLLWQGPLGSWIGQHLTTACHLRGTDGEEAIRNNGRETDGWVAAAPPSDVPIGGVYDT
jgi:hypothetical protein